MIVTGITAITKSRSKVFLDGEFAFVLYKGELRRFHLQEGSEISQRAYEEIMKEVLPKRAKLRAMNLLTKKDYTTAKLREKLMEGGYPEMIIQEALDYVASWTTSAMPWIISSVTGRTRRGVASSRIFLPGGSTGASSRRHFPNGSRQEMPRMRHK